MEVSEPNFKLSSKYGLLGETRPGSEMKKLPGKTYRQRVMMRSIQGLTQKSRKQAANTELKKEKVDGMDIVPRGT